MPMLRSSGLTWNDSAICGNEVLMIALSSISMKNALATMPAISRESIAGCGGWGWDGVMALAGHRTQDGRDDALDAGDRQVLEDVDRRQRNMRGRDAHRRSVQFIERLVGDDRDDLGAPAQKPRVLLHGKGAMGARHRSQDGLGIERHQRA